MKLNIKQNKKKSNLEFQVANIKHRLDQIIEATLKRKQQQCKYQSKLLYLNEGQLQLWQQLLDQIITIKPQVEHSLNHQTSKDIRDTSKLPLGQLPVIRKYSKKLPSQEQSRYLLSLSTDNITVYDLHSDKISPQILKFKKGLIHKNASYNFLTQDKCLIIGGSDQKNQNLKSKDILLLSIETKNIQKYFELYEPISSHSTVLIYPLIYIIGGNRNYNIISKFCYTFNVQSKQLLQISSLNYSASSMVACSWKDQFIYKIGGLGQSFGGFDASPYIERYSIYQDFWQVINPQLKIKTHLIDYFSLSIHSMCFQNQQQNYIVVFGGYNIDKTANSAFFIIKIPNNEQNHQIVDLGISSMKKGGFISNNYVYSQKSQSFYATEIIEQSKSQKLFCYKNGISQYI